MPFQKGNPGRRKGAKGKKTQQWEALAESITGEQAEQFGNYMKELWNSKKASDKDKAADFYLKTVEYFKPKQARVENTHDFKNIPVIKIEDA